MSSTIINAGGPGSGPQGPRQPYIPHPRQAGSSPPATNKSRVLPAQPAKASKPTVVVGPGKEEIDDAKRTLADKKANAEDRANAMAVLAFRPDYAEHASGNVQIKPNGEIKVAKPKDAKEATATLKTMGKVAESALARSNAATSLPLNHPAKITSDLQLAHVTETFGKIMELVHEFIETLHEGYEFAKSKIEDLKKVAELERRSGTNVEAAYCATGPGNGQDNSCSSSRDGGGSANAKDDTAKGREWEKKAVDTFGLTTNPSEAGYVLADGRMLDFSGRKQSGNPELSGIRFIDHGEITAAIKSLNGKGTWAGMHEFMAATGAMRNHFPPQAVRGPGSASNVAYVSFASNPSPDQISYLKDMLDKGNSVEFEFLNDRGASLRSGTIGSDTDLAKFIRDGKQEYASRSAKAAFCPTGKDGGKDNSCSSKDGGGSDPEKSASDKSSPSYVKHAKGNVKISPNGQIKLTTPKSANEASEMLDTMTEIFDSATEDVKAARHLPTNGRGRPSS